MSAPPASSFSGYDGTRLAYRQLGSGRTLILVHGYLSTANTNWIRYGQAALLANHGFRVVMPDLRAHGGSDHPHDPNAYPADVLVDDGLALVEHLRLTDYDLGGYSLGARVAARMVVRGATPGRIVLAGTGLRGLTDAAESSRYFRGVFAGLGRHLRGTDEWQAEAFLRTNHGDPVALERILDTLVDTPPSLLAGIRMPALVVVGEDDEGQASADQLAAVIPRSTFVEIPGTHMSAVTKPGLAEAIADFLTGA